MFAWVFSDDLTRQIGQHPDRLVWQGEMISLIKVSQSYDRSLEPIIRFVFDLPSFGSFLESVVTPFLVESGHEYWVRLFGE